MNKQTKPFNSLTSKINKENSSERLLSLDALRGFDMFWIMGGAAFFIRLSELTGAPVLQWWANQLTHAEWHGFQAYDMIFPLFLFISGVSFPFSAKKRVKMENGRNTLYKHIFKRGLLLVLLGILYNNGVSFDFENMRYASVLGRIGLAWMFAALLFMNTRKTGTRVIWFWGILFFYWLLFILFKAPDLGDQDHFSMRGNIASYIDRLLLPGRFCCFEFGDNEGILAVISATATGLLGILTGEFLSSKLRPMKKVTYMVVTGIFLLFVGQAWNLVFPINKILWSSSFVCWVGGISILLMALFYLVIDVWKQRKWTFFFVVIGMNPLTIYLANRIIRWNSATEFAFAGIADLFPETWSPLIMSVGHIAIGWMFLYFLYKHKIFLRI